MLSQFIKDQPCWRGKDQLIINEILSSVWDGRESSTVRKYSLSFRKFLDFCKLKGYPTVLPFKSEIVAEYLVALNKSKGSKSTTDTAKCAFKWVNSFIPGVNKWNDPTNDDFIAKITSSIHRSSKAVKIRKSLFQEG